MENFVFYIEIPHAISLDDYKNLRKLYLPIAGANAIIIYEYFNDLINKDRMSEVMNINLLSKQLQLDFIIIKDSLEKLEALGLIETYIKKDKSSYIYRINKPCNAEVFNKNPLLKSHLIKMIGQVEYNKFYYEQKEKFSNKSSYKNITKKYQDVFSDVFEKSIEYSDDFYTTLDLKIETYETHEENIEKLPSNFFVKYILNRNANYYETQLINSLLKMGFVDPAINLFLDFSFRFNQQISCSYISTIAHDYFKRSITSFEDVKHELSLAIAHKEQKKEKAKKKQQKYVIKSTNNNRDVFEINDDSNWSIEDFLTQEEIEEII